MANYFLSENISEQVVLASSGQGLAGWEISLIVISAFIVLLGICYCLLFFVLNKYIIVEGKVIRAFRVGTNNGQIHLLTFKGKMEYRVPEEVYETKQKAIIANCKD